MKRNTGEEEDGEEEEECPCLTKEGLGHSLLILPQCTGKAERAAH